MLTLLTDCILGDLPSDWETKPLGTLLVANYPGNWGSDTGTNPLKVLRSTNLTNDGSLDLSDIAQRHLNPNQAETLEPKCGDILLERSGGGPGQPVGRVGFVDRDLPGFAFSSFLHLLRPDKCWINTRFIGWYLYQVNRSGRIVKLEQQTTQLRNLHFRDYLKQPVPLPSMDEQGRIAAILDAADAAIERTREALVATTRLKRALMQQLLPPWIGFKRVADDALPHGIESHLAGKVCRIKNGTTPSRTEYLYWNGGTIPWLATGKVNEQIIRHADEFVTEKALAECRIELLPPGTVLVGMIGQGRTRGMARTLISALASTRISGRLCPEDESSASFCTTIFASTTTDCATWVVARIKAH
jgi:type I restriction enzyme, S subunit